MVDVGPALSDSDAVRYEQLLHLYYTSLFKTVAIIFGFILGSIQIFSILLSQPSPHPTLLLVLFFAAGLGTSFYAARYFAGYYQLEYVMKKLRIFEIDYEILKKVDLFFLWKGLDKDLEDVSQNAARIVQIVALLVVAIVYAWVIDLYWGLWQGAALLITVGGIALAFFLRWQLVEDRWVRAAGRRRAVASVEGGIDSPESVPNDLKQS